MLHVTVLQRYSGGCPRFQKPLGASGNIIIFMRTHKGARCSGLSKLSSLSTYQEAGHSRRAGTFIPSTTTVKRLRSDVKIALGTWCHWLAHPGSVID